MGKSDRVRSICAFSVVSAATELFVASHSDTEDPAVQKLAAGTGIASGWSSAGRSRQRSLEDFSAAMA
jgi:hypothetical protein